MKTPLILKIFAVFNLIIALIGLVIGSAFLIDVIDNAFIWNRDLILTSYILICSGWLLFSSISWLFGFRPAYGLIIVSVVSIFSFLGGVLYFALGAGINQKDERLAITALFIGFSVYALFLLSSMFSKPVKAWKEAKPEMRKWILPLLIAFVIMVFGSHIGIAFGRTEPDYYTSFEDELNEMEYPEESYEVVEEDDYYEEDYYEGEDDYYDVEDAGYIGDLSFFNDKYEESAPYSDTNVYPAPSSGRTMNKNGLNKLFKNFFDGYLANDWDREEDFRGNETIFISTGSYEYSVGLYFGGMLSIYEKINPYFLKEVTLVNKEDCYLQCYAQNLSGITPILVNKEDFGGFNKYNPELVKWMYTYLIPAPSDNFLNDIVAKKLYARVFRRMFRLYTQAYCYAKTNDFENEILAYKNAVQEVNFYGPDYLHNRYASVIESEYDGSLQPPSAIGFWLRRGIDNTDDECWLGMQKVMNQYDSKWFRRILKTYGME